MVVDKSKFTEGNNKLLVYIQYFILAVFFKLTNSNEGHLYTFVPENPQKEKPWQCPELKTPKGL